MRMIPIFFLFLTASLCQAAPYGPGAVSLEYGFFCAMEPISIEEASDTISGTVAIVAGKPVFLSPGPQVPAQLGIGFGVIVRPLPEYVGPVTVSVQHPPMGPDKVTRQNWQAELIADDATYLGYTFEKRYELVPGPWTLSAQANGRPIYEVSFVVTDPGRMRPVTCGANIPLS